jgi:excisionase family DNA binding protein
MPPVKVPPTPLYLRPAAASDYFGTSRSTLHKYIKEKRFRSIKDGGRRLIHVPSATEYFENCDSTGK